MTIKDTGCCPPFDPSPWKGKTIVWKDKLFVKESIFTVFYMPFFFGRKMVKLMKAATKAGAKFTPEITLSDHTSKWNMNLFCPVSKKIPGYKHVRLSGKYYAEVYEGPYKDTQKWVNDYRKKTAKKGLKIVKWYMWYTACPACAKAYGKNYVVILCKVK